MRVQILHEGSRSNEIGYHFTDFTGFVDILNSNMMRATNPAIESNSKIHTWVSVSDTKKQTWSYTRKKDGMHYRNINIPNAVSLTLDIDEVSKNQSIFPFSWENHYKNDDRFEYEERVVGDTKNIIKCIKEVTFNSILDPSYSGRFFTFNPRLERELEELYLVSPSLKDAKEELVELKDDFAKTDIIQSILSDKAKLKSFLTSELKKLNYIFPDLVYRLQIWCNELKRYENADDIINDAGYVLEDFETNDLKLLEKILRLTKRSFKEASSKADEVRHKFIESISRLTDFRVSSKDTYSEIFQSFTKYLNKKGIKVNFSNINLEYLTINNISSGIREDSLEKVIKTLKAKAKNSIDYFKHVKELWNNIHHDYNSIDPEHYEDIPEEVRQVLKELVNEVKTASIASLIKQFSVKGNKNLTVIGRKSSTRDYIAFVIGDTDIVLKKMNRRIQDESKFWQRVSSKNLSNFFYIFPQEKEMFKFLKLKDSSVKIEDLKKYMSSLTGTPNSRINQRLFFIDSKKQLIVDIVSEFSSDLLIPITSIIVNEDYI